MKQAAPRTTNPSRAAGMSDQAVLRATGHDWNTWFIRIDRAGGVRLDHQAIAAHLGEKYGTSPWWSQMITVHYERSRGLRVKNQTCDGSFSANASKTIAAPLEKLYAAWADPRQRAKWLPGAPMKMTTANENKSLRAAWDGGPSRLSVGFLAKAAGKSNVAIGHDNLPNLAAVKKMKAYWLPALERLKRLLER